MLGAIIGDIVGSRFEWHNIKSKEFDLFTRKCEPTDDSIMTLAVAKALLSCDTDYSNLSNRTIEYMQELGRLYPDCGYGGHFRLWLQQAHPKPYNSFGNGSAMRVSPCAYISDSLDDVRSAARIVTNVSHNHPEGVKGALATVDSIFLALHGATKEKIRDNVVQNYYELGFSLDDIRPTYSFDVTCQGSVPQAIEAFLESTSFEDAIRNAISIGGDSDTIAAITGGIAEGYYGIPEDIRNRAMKYLDKVQVDILNKFETKYRIIQGK